MSRFLRSVKEGSTQGKGGKRQIVFTQNDSINVLKQLMQMKCMAKELGCTDVKLFARLHKVHLRALAKVLQGSCFCKPELPLKSRSLA